MQKAFSLVLFLKSPNYRLKNKAKSAPFAVFVYDGAESNLSHIIRDMAWGDYFLPFFQSACLAIRRNEDASKNQAPRLLYYAN